MSHWVVPFPFPWVVPPPHAYGVAFATVWSASWSMCFCCCGVRFWVEEYFVSSSGRGAWFWRSVFPCSVLKNFDSVLRSPGFILWVMEFLFDVLMRVWLAFCGGWMSCM